MSVEQPRFFILEGRQISMGQMVFIREHKACSGNVGVISEIRDKNDYEISCKKCGRNDVSIDVPATLLSLKK